MNTLQDADLVVKKCQRGVGSYKGALGDANNLLSECYGTIGRLILEVEIKNNELSYLYGQDRVPSNYKPEIKRALDGLGELK